MTDQGEDPMDRNTNPNRNPMTVDEYLWLVHYEHDEKKRAGNCF